MIAQTDPIAGDQRILAELKEIRRRAALGLIPAQRRGRMYFDFTANCVCIALLEGAEA